MPEYQPFEFFNEAHLVEVTKDTAKNLKEMLHHLKNVSGSVIYCHTFQTMLRHHFITTGFRNDFAQWVIDAFGDEELGERLSSIDLIEYTTIRDYRNKMIEIVGDHLGRNNGIASRPAREGHRFFFCSSMSFMIPTGRVAHDLRQFAEHLRQCSNSSVFFHFIEARLRVGLPLNDYSVWLIQSGWLK